ncbi:type IV pilus modification PilV family protein [Vibrio splendidus]|uniref:type IV pilus modification PilV family protein n=1 Tax=Vibrio splendidus TaxID=29497 RepID=UPI00076A5C2D|nr:prepilin-type N-terminal cleavage/methylation domain-containing protein [Vibrio splendidus]PHX05456.1 hypothetical protein VSPL_32390 [Vibrio splendidus]
MKKYGFTLIESLIGLSISAIAVGGIMKFQAKNTEKELTQRFIDQSYEIVRAVDHRIAVDGYDPDLWTNKTWKNESEIVNNLINKSLTSKHLKNCSGGTWNPAINSEQKTKIIACKQWETRNNNGESMKANISVDSSGFIQGFNLYISYTNNADFKNNFMNIKKAMLKTENGINQEITGSHYIDFVSIGTKSEIASSKCLQNLSDCAIRFSIDRNGGNEYIRADGSNSMIGEHLTFVETKGQAPMKCVRWKNTKGDGSGVWSRNALDDCGVGVYKESGHPAVVDVAAESGTFENILLDRECNKYIRSGNDVIASGKSPCGTTSNGEIVQVVENIQARKATIQDASFAVANIKSLKADTISTKTLEASSLIKSLNADFSGWVRIGGNATVSGNLKVGGLTALKNATADAIGTTRLVANNVTSKKGRFDETSARDKMSAPIGDFDNINSELAKIKNAMNELSSSNNNDGLEALCNSIDDVHISTYCAGGGRHERRYHRYRSYYWDSKSKQCENRTYDRRSGTC